MTARNDGRALGVSASRPASYIAMSASGTAHRPGDLPQGAAPPWMAFVSFLLFLHLFSLVIGGASSLRGHSDLLETLGTRVPGVAQYAQYFLMRGYGYNLTYNLDIDWDHECDVLVDWRQGIERTPAEVDKLRRLPLIGEDCQFPRQRKRRYQMLAYSVASVVGSDAAEPILPQAISSALLAEADVTSGQHRFRCRRQSLPQPGYWETPPPPVAWFAAYEADTTFFRGEVRISKADAGRLTAPVDRGRAADAPRALQPSGPAKPPIVPPPVLPETRDHGIR